MFNLNSLKTKIVIVCILIGCLSTSLVIAFFIFLQKQKSFINKIELFGAVQLDFDKAQRAYMNFIVQDVINEDFFKNKSSENIDIFNQKISSSVQKLNINNSYSKANEGEILIKRLNDYHEKFREIINLQEERGFRNYGLEGDMRKLVHQLQDTKFESEKVFALGLRRHEKDFLLRKDLMYPQKLAQLCESYINFINEAENMTEAYKKQRIEIINNYKSKFFEIVAIEKELGFTFNNGLKGVLSQLSKEIDTIIQAEVANAELQMDRFETISIWLLRVFLVVFLILIFAVSYFGLNAVLKPINDLTTIAKYASAGEYQKVNLKNRQQRKDELGLLFTAFYSLIETIKQKLKEVEEQNKTLTEAAKVEEKRNWFTQKLDEISLNFRRNLNDEKQAYFTLISQLSKSTGALQATLAIKVSECDADPYLEVVATYAYERKKFDERKFYLGESLIGQAWQEADEIILKDVPDNYAYITSGLGSNKPKMLFICPLKNTNNEVEGVLELAALNNFSEHQLHLVRSICERIGAELMQFRVIRENRKLLEETSNLLQELQASEEEMRQNMEEMQATAEEANRNEKRLNDIIDELKKKNLVLQ
jgi:methyl-accepting chemotaxis protein